MIFINFKTYEKGTGKRVLDLVKIIENVAKEENANIAICVEAPSIYRISKETTLPIYAQHVDPINFGSNTGRILAESIKESGAEGTLLNHSERKMDFFDLKRTVERCKQAGLKTILCVRDIEEAKKTLYMSPNFIAFEDQNLIGSGVSISTKMPEKIREFSEFVVKNNSDTMPLCGAGISKSKDVRLAMEMGVRGVLVASAIVSSENPEKVLREMVKA